MHLKRVRIVLFLLQGQSTDSVFYMQQGQLCYLFIYFFMSVRPITTTEELNVLTCCFCKTVSMFVY